MANEEQHIKELHDFIYQGSTCVHANYGKRVIQLLVKILFGLDRQPDKKQIFNLFDADWIHGVVLTIIKYKLSQLELDYIDCKHDDTYTDTLYLIIFYRNTSITPADTSIDELLQEYENEARRYFLLQCFSDIWVTLKVGESPYMNN